MDINVKLTIGTTEALETTLRWLGEAVSRLYRVDLATGVSEAKETPALPVKATGDATEAPRRDAAPQTPQATQAIEPGAKVEPFPENHCPAITDEELLLQANALMKKFSGKEDTRTATDPTSKAVWAQCKVLFKEIARHFGAPMPSKLPQLMIYALAAFTDADWVYEPGKVTMTIFQPRLGHVSTYETTAAALLEWAEKVLKPTAQLAWEGKGETSKGAWCRFCNAKRICPQHAPDAFPVFDI